MLVLLMVASAEGKEGRREISVLIRPKRAAGEWHERSLSKRLSRHLHHNQNRIVTKQRTGTILSPTLISTRALRADLQQPAGAHRYRRQHGAEDIYFLYWCIRMPTCLRLARCLVRPLEPGICYSLLLRLCGFCVDATRRPWNTVCGERDAGSRQNTATVKCKAFCVDETTG